MFKYFESPIRLSAYITNYNEQFNWLGQGEQHLKYDITMYFKTDLLAWIRLHIHDIPINLHLMKTGREVPSGVHLYYDDLFYN